jgi:hypothetical protein
MTVILHMSEARLTAETCRRHGKEKVGSRVLNIRPVLLPVNHLR